MTRTRLTVAGSTALLAARLDLPDGPPLGFALLAHCFTCGTDQLAAARVARGLAARGIGVLGIDFTGLGVSGGRFEDSTFSADVDDLVRAANHLRTEHSAPTLLIGHSLGGAAVLAAAARIPEVRAVATIGAPYSPDHVAHLFDTAHCETATGQLDRIVREIHLDGDLDDVQRARLLDVADRCPVHRTLGSEIVIETDPV